MEKVLDPLVGVLSAEQLGIDQVTGKPRIHLDVLHEMRQSLMTQDVAERKARELQIYRQVNDLEKDPVARRKYLLLETEEGGQMEVDKGKSITWHGMTDLSTTHSSSSKCGNEYVGPKLMGDSIKAGFLTGSATNMAALLKASVLAELPAPGEVADQEETSSKRDSIAQNRVEKDTFLAKYANMPLLVENLQKEQSISQGGNVENKEGSGSFMPPLEQLEFVIGAGEVGDPKLSGKNQQSRGASSWVRKKRTNSGMDKVAISTQQEDKQTEECSGVKRKKDDGREVSSKLAKTDLGLMVHQKPSSGNI